MQTTPSADEHTGLFVMLLVDGSSYACLSTPLSHGLQRERLSPVSDINQATARSRASWRPFLKYGVLVPVKVERKVTIPPV